MRSVRLLLGAAAAFTCLTLAVPRLHAESAFSVRAVSSPSGAVLPSASGTLTIPFVGAGLAVPGFLPCFNQYCSPEINGVEEVNVPRGFLVRGVQYQFYFPTQTSLWEGDVEVILSIVDSTGANTVVLQGFLFLGFNQLNVVYGTAPTLVPSTLAAGPAMLVATAYGSFGTTTASSNIVLQ